MTAGKLNMRVWDLDVTNRKVPPLPRPAPPAAPVPIRARTPLDQRGMREVREKGM